MVDLLDPQKWRVDPNCKNFPRGSNKNTGQKIEKFPRGSNLFKNTGPKIDNFPRGSNKKRARKIEKFPGGANKV